MRSGRTARSRVVAQAAALPMLPDRHDGGSVLLVGLSPMTSTWGDAAARRAMVLSAPAAHVAASSSYCVYALDVTTTLGWWSAIHWIAASRHGGHVTLRIGVFTVTSVTGQPPFASTTSW